MTLLRRFLDYGLLFMSGGMFFSILDEIDLVEKYCNFIAAVIVLTFFALFSIYLVLDIEYLKKED